MKRVIACKALKAISAALMFGVSSGTFADTPTYSIEPISLMDAEHTRSDGYRDSNIACCAHSVLNQAGYVVGRSERFDGSTSLGNSTWFYNGTSTTIVGLTDAEHTNETDGRRYTRVSHWNTAGNVAGSSDRYGSGGTGLGESAWAYNGTNTVRVGFFDSQHTRFDGYQYSDVAAINQSGQVQGYSGFYATPTSTDTRSEWLFDGTSTINIGFIDDEHTKDSDGTRDSEVYFHTGLNEAGQVAGQSRRFGSASMPLSGYTAWLYDGTNTINIGLTDAEHSGVTAFGVPSRFSDVRVLTDSGQVAGVSARYDGDASLGRTAWLYDGSTTENIGLTDAEHTRDTDGYRWSSIETNQSIGGQIVGSRSVYGSGYMPGFSYRYGVGGTDLGQTAWIHDGTNTNNVGLTDAEHTRDTDGYRHSKIGQMNHSGQAAGTAQRFGAGGADQGISMWIHDGTGTTVVGLTDAEHTRDTDGYRDGIVRLTEAGFADGSSRRYGTGGADLGRSAWFFDGSNTVQVGFTDTEHTRDTDGYRLSSARIVNDDLDVVGSSNRYGPGGSSLGRSVFFYDGDTTQNIGLTDADHTRSTDGYRWSEYYNSFNGNPGINAAGQLFGSADRYRADGTDAGESAWFFDGSQTYSFGGLSFHSNGASSSRVGYLGEDGLVLGYYDYYDESTYRGQRAFRFTVEDGLLDLGLFVEEGFDNWAHLATAISMGAEGVIFGEGAMSDNLWYGSDVFVMTPISAVPIPAGGWLFISALGLLVCQRRYSK